MCSSRLLLCMLHSGRGVQRPTREYVCILMRIWVGLKSVEIVMAPKLSLPMVHMRSAGTCFFSHGVLHTDQMPIILCILGRNFLLGLKLKTSSDHSFLTTCMYLNAVRIYIMFNEVPPFILLVAFCGVSPGGQVRWLLPGHHHTKPHRGENTAPTGIHRPHVCNARIERERPEKPCAAMLGKKMTVYGHQIK